MATHTITVGRVAVELRTGPRNVLAMPLRVSTPHGAYVFHADGRVERPGGEVFGADYELRWGPGAAITHGPTVTVGKRGIATP
jgi:hypothetical protein